jgi:polysaccharide biosynthesis protein PelD
MKKAALAEGREEEVDSIKNIGKFRKILGVRLSAIIELIIFFAIILLLAFFLDRDDLFFSVSPHPFWIIVILLSAQYGTVEGLLAAFVSTVVLLLGEYPERDILQDQFQYFLYIGKNPILWFVAAIVVGEVRNRHIRERDRLKKVAIEAEEKEKTITNSYNSLKAVKERFEVKLASEMQTALMSYEAFKKLEVLDKDVILKGGMDLIKNFIAPECYSIYFLEKAQLKRVCQEGWPQDEAYQTTFGAETRLFQEVIGKGRVASVIYPEDREMLADQGVIAAPIKSVQPLAIYGMAKIEKLHFTQLRMDTIQILRLIGEWIGTAYSSYLAKEEADESRFISPESRLLTLNYLLFQKEFLTNLGKRLQASVVLLYVTLTAKAALSEEEKIAAMKNFRQAVSENLRSVDQAFEYQKSGLEFAVLLVKTSLAGCEIVKDKLDQGLQKVFHQQFSIGYRIEPLYMYEDEKSS